MLNKNQKPYTCNITKYFCNCVYKFYLARSCPPFVYSQYGHRTIRARIAKHIRQAANIIIIMNFVAKYIKLKIIDNVFACVISFNTRRHPNILDVEPC